MVERVSMSNGPPEPRHEPTFLELEEALHIDTLDLTSADAAQPELFYRTAKLLAALKAEHDGLKLACDEEQARAQGKIRDAAEETDRKLTVGQVEAMVRLQPAIKALLERLQQVNKRLLEVNALKEAYSQRKSSLTDLVTLQGQAGAAIDPALIKANMAEQRRGYRRP